MDTARQISAVPGSKGQQSFEEEKKTNTHCVQIPHREKVRDMHKLNNEKDGGDALPFNQG